MKNSSGKRNSGENDERSRSVRKLNVISLRHRKNTENFITAELPLPSKLRIPMSMSMGVPCQPLVKVGDKVKAGQKIGDTDAFFSVPVHSGVSGKVAAIIKYRLVNGSVCKAVEIETDGFQKLSEEVKVRSFPAERVLSGRSGTAAPADLAETDFLCILS